jgi:long-chain acyl-CoA synthetase
MMLVHECLRETAARWADRPSIISSGRVHAFREIDEHSDRLAAELQRLGVRRGDRVCVMLDNSVDLVLALWATLKAGGVFIPISPGTKADKLGFILADCGASALVARADLRPRVDEAAARAAFAGHVIWVGDAPPDAALSLADILASPHQRPTDPGLIDQDLCLIIYTSGSTGNPKGVMLSHRAISNNMWSISSYLRNTPDDVVICVLPLSFDYGLMQVLTGARVGFTVVLEKSFTYPYDILKRVAEYRVTGLPGVPTIFARLLEHAPFDGLDLTSLRYLTNTGAALPVSHISALRAALPRVEIYSMFGLTECTRVGYLDPARLASKPASVGRAMPNSEAYIVDEDGRRCDAREIGELVVRGACLMLGYWNRPEETARALRDGDLPGEKVLFTGDLFWMDEEGDLYFVGRRDDVFKCRGEKVSPREIEACLYELDGVAEAAVVGVADPIDGMAIKAHVVPRPGYEFSEVVLRAHCRKRLEPRLVPRLFQLCESLPKTESGKIQASVLRKMAHAAD